MRALIITEETKKEAQALMAYARRNIYRPGMAVAVSGDDPRFVLHIPHGFRCVFTYTAGKPPATSLYRHLSISVDSEKYPSPEACVMIAQMFEFSGGMGQFEIPQTWQLGMNEQEHCIVLIEELKDGDPK